MTRGLDRSSSRTQTCQKWCPKCLFYGKTIKISGLIQDDHIWFQETSGRRSERQSYQKTHQLEKFEKFQNHPKPTTSYFENGSTSQISLCWRTIFLQMSSRASWSIIMVRSTLLHLLTRGALRAKSKVQRKYSLLELPRISSQHL